MTFVFFKGIYPYGTQQLLGAEHQNKIIKMTSIFVDLLLATPKGFEMTRGDTGIISYFQMFCTTRILLIVGFYTVACSDMKAKCRLYSLCE